jgi:Tfp pilus assembly major pilin PilA
VSLQKQQRGLTLISWIVVIAIAVFLGLIGIKSLPVYMNHYKIVSIMNNVAGQPGVAEQSAAEIRKSFERRFDIDMVKHLDHKDVKVVGNPGGPRKIVAEYEVRIPMFYNVHAVYVFKEEIPLGQH